MFLNIIGVTSKPFKLLLELCNGDLGFLLCVDDLAELIVDTDCGGGLRFPKVILFSSSIP